MRNVISERALLAQDNARHRAVRRLSVAKAELESLKNDVEEKLGEAKHLLDRLQAADRAVLAAQRGSRDAGSERQPLEYYTGSASGPAAEAIAFAYAQLGDRYVYGAAGPNSWDCSGLTMGAWERPAFPAAFLAQYSGGRGCARAATGRPGVLLLTDQPRGPLHRRRPDDPRVQSEQAGVDLVDRPQWPVRRSRPPLISVVGSA